MISLLGIAFDRGSQMVFKGHFYFSFGGINNIVEFDLLHCMLFVSLTVSFGFTSKLKFYFQICLCLVKRYLLEISNVTPS